MVSVDRAENNQICKNVDSRCIICILLLWRKQMQYAVMIYFDDDTNNELLGYIKDLKDYLENFMNFQITTLSETLGEATALLYMVSLIIIIFLLKNIFNYAAMFFITFLRNGVLKDIRNDLYQKTVSLLKPKRSQNGTIFCENYP